MNTDSSDESVKDDCKNMQGIDKGRKLLWLKKTG